MFSGLLKPMHLLVILVIVLIIFGTGKLSEVGGALGKGLKAFKSEIKDEHDTTLPENQQKIEYKTEEKDWFSGIVSSLEKMFKFR